MSNGLRSRRCDEQELEAVIGGCCLSFAGLGFRQARPAIVGVQVIGGVVRTQVNLMREDGANVGEIRGIQARNENVGSATVGQEVAISIDGPIEAARSMSQYPLCHIPESMPHWSSN